MSSIGGDDIFVAKMDVDGNWLWATKAGGIDDDCGKGIAIDDYSNSYVTGFFSNVATFSTTTLSSSGENDIFVAKLESDFEANFNANPTSGYVPLEVEFTDLSIGNIVSWQWDFQNDGVIDSYLQNPDFTYTEIGVYAVSLTVSDGFNTDTKVEENYITAEGPTADFIANVTIGYVPLEVEFTDLSTGNIILWQWDFQNDGVIDSYLQNPDFIYSEIGVYTVSLTVSDGFYTDTKVEENYIIVEGPMADFIANVTIGYVPLEVEFTDLSSGNIISWQWDFQNDGIIDSSEQNPIWIYEESDLYTVSLTISDGVNTDTETKIEYISAYDSLIAEFEANITSGVVPLEIQFADLSTGNIIEWSWDFENDGIIDSNEQNPIWIYEESDLYTVSLTISDGINTDIETKVEYISVYDSLIAEFEADSTFGYAPLEVQFTDLSTPSQNPIIIWEWDFQNDGIIDSYLQNPIYIYSEAGVYTVSLTISDSVNEDTEIKEDYITVIEPLDADFEANITSGNAPLEVQFTDLSTGDITGWMWDFDNDGTIDSNEQNPIYTYNDAGVYTVSLTITDGSNEDTEIKEDYITVISTGIHNEIIPSETRLYHNHPNPFNPITNIQLDIKKNETGVLSIYNIKGQLLESQQFEAGQHNFNWDASEQSSGVYLYKLQTESFSKTNKMLLLK
jgi:PKD repeat protein